MKALKLSLKIALFLVIGFVALSIGLAIFLPEGALDKYDDKLIHADKNDWTELGLKGDVKSLVTIEYRFIYYDAEGENNTVLTTTTRKFNKIGFITEIIVEENDLVTRTKYKYNWQDKSKIESENYFMGNNQTMDVKWIYNKDGKGATKEFYTHKGPLFNVVKYKYDDHGNIIHKGYYTDSDSLVSEESFKFDDDGNQIEYISYPADNGTIVRYNYEYENGKLFKEYESSLWNRTSTYKYNEQGDEIELKIDVEGFNSTLSTYTYEYDKHGNWTKQTVNFNNQQEAITERTISYY